MRLWKANMMNKILTYGSEGKMTLFSELLNYMDDTLKVADYLGMSSFPSSKPKPYKVYELSPKPEQGRNEKCNCGSGLKFKKCCGKEV